MAMIIVTTGNHRTIRFQSNRFSVAGGNCHNSCPAGYIASTARGNPTGNHRTIGFQPDRMGVTDGNHTWRMAVIVCRQLFLQFLFAACFILFSAACFLLTAYFLLAACFFTAAVCFLYALLFFPRKPFRVFVSQPFCVGQFVCQRTACKLSGALIFAALHHLDDIRTSFLPRSDPPCRQQQHHISVRTLRVNIQHLLGVLCGELGILILQKHLCPLQ